jgi:hypothetical protein
MCLAASLFPVFAQRVFLGICAVLVGPLFNSNNHGQAEDDDKANPMKPRAVFSAACQLDPSSGQNENC